MKSIIKHIRLSERDQERLDEVKANTFVFTETQAIREALKIASEAVRK